MSVRRDKAGTIVLDGSCPVEDAETLLQLLQTTPGAPVDWTRSTHLHTAVLQLILAARPAQLGPCGDQWIRQWFSPDALEARAVGGSGRRRDEGTPVRRRAADPQHSSTSRNP